VHEPVLLLDAAHPLPSVEKGNRKIHLLFRFPNPPHPHFFSLSLNHSAEYLSSNDRPLIRNPIMMPTLLGVINEPDETERTLLL
jgi:hypothetical protein